jgi:Flp pilus assembly protein TadG
MSRAALPWWLATQALRRAILGSSPRTRLARARQGTTAVEFAICALAMVLMVVGFVEFGRRTWTFEVLQDAATEGARCMGLRSSTSIP